MAGTFVAQPALQAVLWAIDGAGGTGSAQIAEINVARALASRAFDFPPREAP